MCLFVDVGCWVWCCLVCVGVTWLCCFSVGARVLLGWVAFVGVVAMFCLKGPCGFRVAGLGVFVVYLVV